MKKFIALLLIFSPVLLSGNLVAKEWKHSFSLKTQKAKEWKYGFTLSTQKTTEQYIMEKFTPEKKNSIILLEPKFEMDVSFANGININFSSEFWKGFLYGGLIGGAAGALMGFISGDDRSGWFAWTAGQKAVGFGAVGFVVGGVIGGIIAVVN